jgi:hypothetical protein
MKKQVVLLAALLVIATGAVTFASIPSASGVIHGCYRRSDGQLRVINRDLGRTCRAGEKALSWKQRGPRGLRGPQGIQGIQGEPGISSHSLTEAIVASYKPATEAGSIASWTQPANTIARVYWRVTITTPGDPCQSSEAANVSFALSINDEPVAGPQEQTVGPGEAETIPVLGSFSDGLVLLPGEYALTTETTTVNNVAPDCEETVVDTEVYVETVGGP